MKRFSLFSIFLALTLALTACGSNNTRSGGFRSGGAAAVLTPETKLAVGTIKLDGTAQAVDSQEAAQLLPLWQLMSELYSNSAAAPQEFTAVVDQVQSTMKPAQLKAIDDMSLTGSDVFSVFQGQGGFAGGGNGSSPRSGGSSNFTGGNRGGNGGGQTFVFAGGPGGGGPGGFSGGGFPGGGGFGNRTQSNSSQSGSSTQNAQSFQNTAGKLIVDQLIKLLEGKIKS